MDNWITKQAQLAPQNIAVTDGHQSLTFATLAQRLTQVAGQLAAVGALTQPRVAMLTDNSLAGYQVALALLGTGHTIVWLNKRLPTTELRRQLQDSTVATCLVADDLWREGLGVNAVRFGTLLTTAATPRSLVATFDVHQVASIMYTSGTTGQPKGVLQTFENHYTSAIASALNLGVMPDDEWLCTVPIFHISGFSIMMRGLIYGMTVRLVPQFDAPAIAHILRTEPVTLISVVPFMLKKLLDQQPPTATPYCALRGMLLGGGPIDQATLRRCQQQGVPVVQSYGMTETASQVVALNFADAPSHVGSSGKPLFTTQLQLTPQTHEILLKTPALAAGYLGQPEKFAAKLTADGWYHTGDVGHLDEAGFLYVDGRLDDMIISGGENIFPDAIEAAYQSAPGVRDIAVVGRSDAEWGMVPVAFVVIDHPLDVAALVAFGRQHLAHYQVPQTFIPVAEIPHNGNGKVQRAKLRARLSATHSD